MDSGYRRLCTLRDIQELDRLNGYIQNPFARPKRDKNKEVDVADETQLHSVTLESHVKVMLVLYAPCIRECEGKNCPVLLPTGRTTMCFAESFLIEI